jgi:16S rRNA processing protein RimM
MGERLAIGKVAATFGLHGEVKVTSYSGESKHFADLKEICLVKTGKEQIRKIVSVRSHGRYLLVLFEDIGGIDEAENIVGSELWAERSRCAALSDGEYYIADLCGCSVCYAGNAVGKVIGTLEGVQAELLEVEKNDGTIRLVPLMDVYIGEIDVTVGRIELRNDWIVE